MKKRFRKRIFFEKFKGRTIMTLECNKNSFDEYDLYRQYWKCRNFELQNLWQRSIFLATFLVLCFTGYGFFFVHAFFENSNVTVFNNDVNLLPAHIIAAVSSLIGMVMSVLWACMAKGSKAWYEVYEHSIKVLEKQPNFTKSSFLRAYDIGCFEQEKLPEYKSKGDTPQFDTELFSLKGGLYSPSKINIVIGPICFLIFCALFSLHCGAFFLISNLAWSNIVFGTMSLFLLIWLMSKKAWNNLSLRSGVLKDKDPAGESNYKIHNLKGE